MQVIDLLLHDKVLMVFNSVKVHVTATAFVIFFIATGVVFFFDQVVVPLLVLVLKEVFVEQQAVGMIDTTCFLGGILRVTLYS